MEIIGTVKDIKILKQGRGGLNGVTIEFETDTTINDKSVVGIGFENTLKPFNVMEVEVSGSKLLGRALECGYWAQKLDRKEGLDFRTLLGSEVKLVTDEKVKAEIYQQSCWC